MKNVKYLIDKYGGLSDACYHALAEWRNSPRADGYSPAQMFFGRRQRGILPATGSAYDPIDMKDAQKAREKKQTASKKSFDNSAKDLEPLQVGMKVRMQNPISKRWNRNGVIESIRQDGRSYYVLSGNTRYLRNRRYLKASENQVIHDEMECADKPVPSALRRSSRIANMRPKSVHFEL